MNCLHPRVIPDPTGKMVVDPLTGVNVPAPMDVPCGKCIACRINKRREWTQRLLHEQSFASTSCFVTITYDQDHVPINGDGLMEVCKHDIQLYHRYIRKKYPDVTFRFFLNSEYGPETQRPHYHAIYYNLPEEAIYSGTPAFEKRKLKYYYAGALEKIWAKGEVTTAPMTRERAGYCAKYFIDKADSPEFCAPNFSLMSRKPGIGSQYCNQIESKVRFYGLRGCLTDKGNYIKLPRYYRDKIHPPYERLWNRLLGIDQITEEEAILLREKADFMVDNSENIEYQIHRSMTHKGHKSKL